MRGLRFPVVAAATVLRLVSLAGTGTAAVASGTSAVAATPPEGTGRVAVSAPDGDRALPTAPVRPVPAGDEIVVGRGDSAGWHLNLAGCPNPPVGWHQGGTFAVQFGDVTVTGDDFDWHQLGVGFGGHTWFTHTTDPHVVRHIATATWSVPGLHGLYDVYVYVPDNGAVAIGNYTVNDVRGSATVSLDQSQHGNEWGPLPDYYSTYWFRDGQR